MLIGIAGSTALLLAGFGIKDAVEISVQFNQMYQFDIELSIAPNPLRYLKITIHSI